MYLIAASFCQPAIPVDARANLRGAVKTAANNKLKIKNAQHWWVTPGGVTSTGSGDGSTSASSDSQLSGSKSGSAIGYSGAGNNSGIGGAAGSLLGGLSGSSGSSGGSSAGGGSNQAKEKIEFDDSASKNNSGRPLSGGNGPGGANPVSKAFDLFYPMCLFMDGKAVSKQQGNETIKRMTDNMAQKCGVNLVVFPVTVAPGSYSTDPTAAEENNNFQKDACNIQGNIPNVTNASTSFCVDSPAMADEMCKSYCETPDKPELCDPVYPKYKPGLNVAGCAVVNSKTGDADYKKIVKDWENRRDNAKAAAIAAGKDFEDDPEYKRAVARLKGIKADGSAGGGSGAMPIAPSIEDAGKCTPMIVAHESIGHSMMGMPNGSGHGNGIGPEEDGDMTEGWTPAGCQQIIKNAMPNDGTWRWEANRQTYYTPPKDQSAWWNMRGGKKLFNPPQGPPLGGQPTLPKISGPGKQVVFDDSVSKQGGGSGASNPPSGGGKGSGSSAPPPVDSDDPRHKKRPGEAIASNAQKITKAGTSPGIKGDPSDETFAERPRNPPPNGRPVPRQSIGFDDSAAKNQSAGTAPVGTVSKPPTEPIPGGRGGNFAASGKGASQGTTYDDEAPKGEAAGGSQMRSTAVGLTGGRTGGSTTYDDSAAKGGAPGSLVGTTASGDRAPASSGGVSLQGGPGAGLSGTDFFKGVGRGKDLSDEEVDEQQRLKRRRQLEKQDPAQVSRRQSGRRGAGRTPRSIGGEE